MRWLIFLSMILYPYAVLLRSWESGISVNVLIFTFRSSLPHVVYSVHHLSILLFKIQVPITATPSISIQILIQEWDTISYAFFYSTHAICNTVSLQLHFFTIILSIISCSLAPLDFLFPPSCSSDDKSSFPKWSYSSSAAIPLTTSKPEEGTLLVCS